MYPHMKIDDCRTYTSREIQLYAKSEGRSDGPTDRAKV